MANKKITELTALTTAAADDVLAIVDVGGTAETKKITVANLTKGAGGTTTVKVELTNADVADMRYNNLPITLKAAETDKIIMPITVICVASHGGINETSSDDLRMGWNAASSTTVDYWGSARDWMNGVSSGTNSTSFGGASASSSATTYTFTLTDTPFQIWCTDNFLGGWTMDVYFSYVMIDA